MFRGRKILHFSRIVKQLQNYYARQWPYIAKFKQFKCNTAKLLFQNTNIHDIRETFSPRNILRLRYIVKVAYRSLQLSRTIKYSLLHYLKHFAAFLSFNLAYFTLALRNQWQLVYIQLYPEGITYKPLWFLWSAHTMGYKYCYIYYLSMCGEYVYTVFPQIKASSE